MKKRSMKFYKPSASFLLILIAVLLVKWNSSSAALVTRTWDGGGATGNWSEGANWSGDVAPVAGDDVVFDATSTKNAVIDINFDIANLNINSGYTGTITLADGKSLTLQNGTASSQAGGAFVCGNGALVSFKNVNYTQTGGQFNCQNGQINSEFFNLTINGGTFNAPSATMEFSGTSAVEIGSSGTFNHNGGTLSALGNFLTFRIVNGAAATLDINNLTINLINPGGAVSLNEETDKLRVLGTLNLIKGDTAGTFEAQGAVSISETWGTNNQSGKLLITGSATRTITLPTLGLNQFGQQIFYVPIELDTPNVTMNTSGAGPVRLKSLDLKQGTFNTDAIPFSLGTADTFRDSTQSGGMFNCGGLVSLNAVNFTQTGGQFNCQNGTINSNFVNLFLNGGTFNAPSATMTIQTLAGVGATIQRGGASTFNHNNGTVVFAGETVFLKAINGAPAEFDFNTLVVNANNQLNLETGNVKARIFGNLNLNSGAVFGGNSQTRGSLEARGNVTIGSGVSNNGNTADFIFAGSGIQTFTNNGGSNPQGTWTINKTGGTVVLASPLTLSNSTENFNLTEGTITTGANTIDLGTRNVSRANGRVIGNLKRRFTALGTKVFDVGTANGYAPVSVEATSLAANPTDLTVGNTQGTHPLLSPNIALGRFWSIAESGNITANLTFNYLQTDVNGNENNYKVNRIENGQVQVLEPPTATVDISNNTATVTNVTEFSDWTLSGTTAPLVISPTNQTVDAGASLTFTASGGQPPFVFSIPVNNSGASINPATGFYIAGATFGVQDTVRVTDANNQTAETSVSVVNPFLVTNTNDSGVGSLRQAIINANSTAGTQTISFNIPGTPPFTIAPASALPAITDSVVINGASQPGFAGTPVIELNGANAGNVEEGVKIQANNTTVKGLVINRFVNRGMTLDGVNGGTIQGNFIGTGTDGITPRPNGFQGIALNNSTLVTIGGASALQRNVVSGNAFDGIILLNSDNNIVRGNYVGVGADGTSPLGNGRSGISFAGDSEGNHIGGGSEGDGNIVAFTGTVNPPVTPDGGIVLPGNITRNQIRGNSVFSNAGLGIDLGTSGITPNDPCDADAGTNNLQNFPVLTFATVSSLNTQIHGTLNSIASRNFEVDFYSSPQSDPSGNGEGKTLIHSQQLSTTADCTRSFSITLPSRPELAGQFITATMTDADGNTSEFSAAIPVTAVCNFSINPTSQNFNANGGNGTVTVNTDQNCQWTAASNDSFITILSGSSGTGQGNVNFSVAPNTTGAPRTGTMTIAGQTFTVTQDANCVFAINPAAQNFGLLGGAGVISVQTNAGCKWTAASNNPFISITGGGSGSGAGQVNYTVAGSPDGNPRAGTITVAGKTFTVIQAANNSACTTADFRIQSNQIAEVGSFFDSANDFNRDGILDLLYFKISAPSNISIFLGKGDGTFGSPIVIGLGDESVFRGAIEADFNNDGLLDLAIKVLNSATQQTEIRIALGNGAGGFSISTTLTNFSIFFDGFIAGDFNRDGKQDLIAGKNTANQFQVFFGNGDGTFDAPLDRTGTFVNELRTADFNRDGKLDFTAVAANRTDVYLGNGNGDFSVSASLQANNTFSDAVVEDFNRDGKPDIAAVDATPPPNVSTIKIFLGNGTGGFASPIPLQPVNGLQSLSAGDFNRDGKLDLTFFGGPTNIAVFRGDGTGNFSAPNIFNVPNSGNGFVGDVNSDGKADIVTNSTILLNSCGGLTQKPKIDFDGDGRTDFAIFRPATGEWYALRSSDNSYFSFTFGTKGDLPAAADFDGDGKTDAAVFRPSTGVWFILRSSDAGTTILQFGQNGDRPAAGDYDGDGRADLAVFRPADGVWWVRKSSDGAVFAVQWGLGSDIIIQ